MQKARRQTQVEPSRMAEHAHAHAHRSVIVLLRRSRYCYSSSTSTIFLLKKKKKYIYMYISFLSFFFIRPEVIHNGFCGTGNTFTLKDTFLNVYVLTHLQ